MFVQMVLHAYHTVIIHSEVDDTPMTVFRRVESAFNLMHEHKILYQYVLSNNGYKAEFKITRESSVITAEIVERGFDKFVEWYEKKEPVPVGTKRGLLLT